MRNNKGQSWGEILHYIYWFVFISIILFVVLSAAPSLTGIVSTTTSAVSDAGGGLSFGSTYIGKLL